MTDNNIDKNNPDEESLLDQDNLDAEEEKSRVKAIEEAGNKAYAKVLYTTSSAVGQAQKVYARYQYMEDKLKFLESAEKMINEGYLTAYGPDGQCVLCVSGDYHVLFSVSEESWGEIKKCQGHQVEGFEPADDYRIKQFKKLEDILRAPARKAAFENNVST